MAGQTSAKYWANTEVLETFMALMYQKVQGMVNKKIGDSTSAMSEMTNKAKECKSQLSQFTAAAKTDITATKTSAEASINSTKTQVLGDIEAKYNTYETKVRSLTEKLTEAIMTQEEYDTLIGSYDPDDPDVPGKVETSSGETWYYLPNAIMTPGQLEIMKATGSVTTKYEGSEKTWYYVIEAGVKYACDASTFAEATRKVKCEDALGKGVFTTYYIIEE